MMEGPLMTAIISKTRRTTRLRNLSSYGWPIRDGRWEGVKPAAALAE